MRREGGARGERVTSDPGGDERTLGGGGGGSDAPRMYCVAVMSPMSWPRGLVELTYPLVRLDWPRPYFSRNRGSFRMANALNVRSTDWQNVQSVIPTEGWRRPTRRRGRVLGGRASVRGQLSARSRCALRSRGHERRAIRPRARDGMANPPLRAKFPTLRGGGAERCRIFSRTRGCFAIPFVGPDRTG